MRRSVLSVTAVVFAAAALALPGAAAAAPACTIVGTAGPDKLRGTAGNDVICGLGGNDTIAGLGGHDVIRGGPGNDTLLGGAGNDLIDGGTGKDQINGGPGHDRLNGGAGNDRIGGGPGNDTLVGEAGNDWIGGGTGGDRLYGGPGNDRLYGGSGKDRLYGGSGRDELDGESGNDRINGGAGADVLHVAGGRDTIEFPDARDTVIGGTASTPPPPPPPPPTPGQWSDPAGDRPSWVPDITTVRVGDDGAGRLTFRLDIPNRERLAQDIHVNIGLDTDQNPATGDTEGGNEGDEYLIVVDGDPPGVYLGRWDGAAWEWLYPTVAVEWRFGVTVTIDLRDVGNPRAFNFWVGAWSDNPDGSGTRADIAPNTGTWNYRVGTATDGPLPTGAFIIEYVPSGDPQTQGLIDWIDESDLLDWLAQRLNAAYALPEDITVVVMEDTDGPALLPRIPGDHDAARVPRHDPVPLH